MSENIFLYIIYIIHGRPFAGKEGQWRIRLLALHTEGGSKLQ